MPFIKGHKTTAETRAKMSAALRGANHPFYGRKHTAEAKAKMSTALRGVRSRNWRGGRYTTERGYVRIFRPNHPHASARGYVLEHRLVMEAHLGRTLLPTEVVHHINGDTDDNRIENLMRFSSDADHRQWHQENKE